MFRGWELSSPLAKILSQVLLASRAKAEVAGRCVWGPPSFQAGCLLSSRVFIFQDPRFLKLSLSVLVAITRAFHLSSPCQVRWGSTQLPTWDTWLWVPHPDWPQCCTASFWFPPCPRSTSNSSFKLLTPCPLCLAQNEENLRVFPWCWGLQTKVAGGAFWAESPFCPLVPTTFRCKQEPPAPCFNPVNRALGKRDPQGRVSGTRGLPCTPSIAGFSIISSRVL